MNEEIIEQTKNQTGTSEEKTLSGKISEDMERRIANLTLMDDAFMTMCFQDNIPAVELVLNVILDRDDLHVVHMEVQRTEKSPVVGGRDIRLDIYARDNAGKYYDIEIQRSDKGAGSKRARLYSAMIDAEMLQQGDDFEVLKDSYVIFITENDIPGENIPVYFIQRSYMHNGRSFGDGSHIIYVNGAYKNDGTKIGNLIHDFKCKDPDEMVNDALKNSVAHFKQSEGGKQSMSRVLEEYGEEIREATAKYYEQRMAEKDAALSEQAAAISEKDAEIIRLKAELARQKGA